VGGEVSGPTIAHYAQYYAIRAAAGAFGRLDFRRAGRIGERIGELGYRPLGVRRAVVERQVRAAFPGLEEREVLRIARAAYGHLGRTTIETTVLSNYSREQVLGLFDGEEGWEHVERAMALGRGVMFVSGHVGNWELGGSYIAARGGVPFEAVARRMENPLFDAYLTKTRRRIGMIVIPDSEAVRRVPRAMREQHGVAFLIDQGAAGLASTWVPFFGRYAKTPRGPAVFALRLKTPLVFACAIRQPNGRFIMHFEDVPIAPPTGVLDTDVDQIVAAYTNVLERWVRRAPEQYFWHHRRWKHQRPDTPPELGDPS
jgi:KDO2-lipid IV(A) lauroyltransferase